MSGKKQISAEPTIWIKRLCIYTSTGDVKNRLREIEFKKGINLVWGVELDDKAGIDAAHPVRLSGHSVGKTSLCRLIRYCLGEDSFGNQSAMERTRHTFPKGSVGMDLSINGESWSVMRTFSAKDIGFAMKADVHEMLFESDSKKNQFKEYLANLQNSIRSDLTEIFPAGAARSFSWFHVLAWLARDQEARFQSLYDWRSSRSDAKSANFSSPKEHPLYLIRLILDLVQDDEIRMSGDLSKLKKEIESLETEIKEKQKEPVYNKNASESELRAILKLPVDTPLDLEDESLLSKEREFKTLSTGERENLERDVRELESHMISAEAKNQNIEKEIGEWRVIIHAKKEGKESSTNDYSGQIEVIHNHREDYCRAGDVKIGKCEKVIDRENRLKESMNSNLTDISSALEKKRLAEEEKQRKETVQAAEKRIQELQAETAKNNEQKGTLRGKKVRGEQKLFLLKQRISQFESQLRIYRKSSDLIAGKIENTELKESQAELTEKRKHYESLQRDLKQLNELQKKKSRTIQKIFDTLVKKTLSDEYSGQIDFRNNEIQFQIQEAAGMTGEAVETLSHVLADLTALQCSMNGIGFHPRFLLHDSPREADLDRHIYERYLGMVMKLATDNGKRSSEDAPFQYIVTTTSKPPDDLKSVVRVKLQGHPHSELLFRQVLKAPSAEQLELSLTHE